MQVVVILELVFHAGFLAPLQTFFTRQVSEWRRMGHDGAKERV